MNRLDNAIVRGVFQFVDDTGYMQTAQASVLYGELSDGVPHQQSYGLTAYPRPKDSDGRGPEAVVLGIAGRKSDRVAVAVDDRRYRPRAGALKVGDAALYTHRDALPDDAGSTAWLDSARHRLQLTETAGGKRLIGARAANDGGTNHSYWRQDEDGNWTLTCTAGSNVASITVTPTGIVESVTNGSATTTRTISATGITDVTTTFQQTATTHTTNATNIVRNSANISDSP